jgi:hypothetical protein
VSQLVRPQRAVSSLNRLRAAALAGIGASEIDCPVWSVSDRGTTGAFRSSRTDRGAQVLPPARATVPPSLRESSSRVSSLLACYALGPGRARKMDRYRSSHRAANKISRSSATSSAATSLSNRRLYVAQRIRGGLSGHSSSAINCLNGRSGRSHTWAGLPSGDKQPRRQYQARRLCRQLCFRAASAARRAAHTGRDADGVAAGSGPSSGRQNAGIVPWTSVP